MLTRQHKNLGAGRGPKRSRSYLLGQPLISIGLTLVCAGILGLILYAASGVSYLSNPPGDALFAQQNECLTRALGGSRLGFAISPDGSLAAGYGETRIAVCSRGSPTAKRIVNRRGISSAAFDFNNRLWLTQGQGTALTVSWIGMEAGKEVEETVNFPGPWDSIIALTGHRQGVVILDGQGRLVSMSSTGAVLGEAELPIRPFKFAEMSPNSDGTFVAIATTHALFVYRTSDLSLVQRQAPCDVRFVWWAVRPNEAILDCDSDAGVALFFDALTGSVEVLSRRQRIHSRFIPGLAGYVQSCENLPCLAAPP